MKTLFWVVLLGAQVCLASRNWTKVFISGAVCGNGEPYFVFLDQKASDKIAFSFMGGGACWDAESCHGKDSMASLEPIDFTPNEGGFTSTKKWISPVSSSTLVFVPYCTGDVHLGNHTADYSHGPVQHRGLSNFIKTLSFLTQEGRINLALAKEVVVYGYSAGALGALIHASHIGDYVNVSTKKVLIADSPGLHFGKTFWKKFSSGLIQDYSNALALLGGTLDPSTGNLTPLIPKVCETYSDWHVGFLQSTQDFIMSYVFGDISPLDHEKLVLGKRGLLDRTKDPEDQCSAWVPRNPFHTFLAVNETMGFLAGHKSARKYMFDVIKRKNLRNSY